MPTAFTCFVPKYAHTGKESAQFSPLLHGLKPSDPLPEALVMRVFSEAAKLTTALCYL